jgi:predicted transcriptional regulator
MSLTDAGIRTTIYVLSTTCGAVPRPLLAKGFVMEESNRPKWLRSTKGAPFTGIGSLEADILAVVWELGETTVRRVYETLRARRQIAYTTVMTVMNNLVKKHLLTQDRSAIAYIYAPAIPGREVAQTVLESVVDRLLTGQYNVAVSQLLKLDGELTPEQTDQLRTFAEDMLKA